MERKCPFCNNECKYLLHRQNLEKEYESVVKESNIIAIEGIVGAGKTLLVEYMKKRRFVDEIIPEYTILAKKDSLPVFSPNKKILEQSTCFYAGIELSRQKELLYLTKKRSRTILLDRSELSILSFNYAVEKRYSLQGLFTQTQDCLNNVMIFYPNVYIYLDIPFCVSVDRMMARGSFKESPFTDQSFVNYSIIGYRSLLEKNNHITIDGNLPIARTSQEILRVI